jgi:hypothetical protein
MDDQVPVCLHRECSLSNAGDEQRVTDPGYEREQENDGERRPNLLPHDPDCGLWRHR